MTARPREAPAAGRSRAGGTSPPAARRHGLLNGLDAALRRGCEGVVVAGIGVLFATLLGNTLLRYLAGGGLRWAADVAALVFPWVIAAGMILAARAGQHVAVAVVVELLPPAARRAVALGVALLVIVTYVALAGAAYDVVAITLRQRLPVLDVPLACAYAALILAAVGMIAATVLGLARVPLEPDAEPARGKGVS